MTSTLTVLLTAVLRSLRGSTLKIFSNTSAGNVLLMHQSVIAASHFSHLDILPYSEELTFDPLSLCCVSVPGQGAAAAHT